MSVKELCARIEKLSVEIDLQKELVKQLERDRSLARRQLNAVLDPISRLPFDISSEIFFHTLPPSRPEPGAHHSPMLLLNICNAWTTVALSTPTLWAEIRIIFPCSRGLKEVLPIWLRRAQRRPLALSLVGKLNKGVADVIWGHSHQLKHLEICEGWGKVSDGMDLLEGMVPEPLPLLETLRIRRPTGRSYRLYYSNTQVLELLRQAPSLVQCVLEVTVVRVDSGSEVPAQPLVLPFLRQLRFGEDTPGSKSTGEGVLEYLLVPALDTLSIELSDDLVSFLKRSSPPLRDLVLRGPSRSIDNSLKECLRLVPTIRQFEMRSSSRLAEELWTALVDTPSLLPCLHTLRIRVFFRSISDVWWPTLVRALSARRTQIRVVSVISLVNVAETLAADIYAAFSELVADGMQIYIGNADGVSNVNQAHEIAFT